MPSFIIKANTIGDVCHWDALFAWLHFLALNFEDIMGMKSMSEVEFLLWPEHQRVASRSSHLKQNRNIISEKKKYHYQKTECFFTCSAESSTDLYRNIRQKFKLTTVIIHFCLFYWPLTKIRYDSHLPEVRTTNYTNRSSHRAGLDINRSYSQVLWHPEDDPWH